MSWFPSWNTNKSATGTTALQVQKSKQIESLQRNNIGIAEIRRDVEYRLTFLSGRTSYTLFITLPTEFPQVRASVRINPSGQHPWISETGELVACPVLNSFTIQSDLGLAIKSIVEELSKNPPVLGPMSFGQPPTRPQLPYPINPVEHISIPSVRNPVPSVSTSVCQMPAPNPSHFYSQQANAGYSMPDIPNAFPELRQLSAKELQKLIEDESLLLQRLSGNTALEQLVADVKNIAAANEQLATTNLTRQPDFEEAKSALLVKHEHESELREELDSLVSKQKDISAHLSPHALQDNLSIAASESEQASDQLVEGLLTGTVKMDEFIKQFMPLRTKYHARRIQEEKLQHLLSNS